MSERVIILAAGEGTRLHPYTLDRPKCMVEFAGHPLIEYQLATLKQAGITDINLVTGYKPETLKAFGHKIFHNSDYAKTNMVMSLLSASELFDGKADILIAYADILYQGNAIEAIRRFPSENMVLPVNMKWMDVWKLRMDDPLSDAESLKMDKNDHILEIGKKAHSLADAQAQYMGLIRVKADFQKPLMKMIDAMDRAKTYDGRPFATMFMTSLIQYVIDAGVKVKAARVDGGWLEIDSVQDKEAYENLLAENKLTRYWTPPFKISAISRAPTSSDSSKR